MRYDYEVQRYSGHGYECIIVEETRKAALKRLQEYRENEPGIPFRIRRVKTPTPGKVIRESAWLVRSRGDNGIARVWPKEVAP